MQLVDSATGQVVHRYVAAYSTQQPIVTPPNSDDPRIALAGIGTVTPATSGTAWINELGQLIQKVGTDDLYYIDGQLYERLPNGSYFKVSANGGYAGTIAGVPIGTVLLIVASIGLFFWFKSKRS